MRQDFLDNLPFCCYNIQNEVFMKGVSHMTKITLRIDGMMCPRCEAHMNETVLKEYPKAKVTSSHAKKETVIITADAKQGTLAYFFNPTPRDMVIPCDWARILGDDDWQLYRLHGDHSSTRETGYVSVPAQSGVLFFASRQSFDGEPCNMWDWQA